MFRSFHAAKIAKKPEKPKKFSIPPPVLPHENRIFAIAGPRNFAVSKKIRIL